MNASCRFQRLRNAPAGALLLAAMLSAALHATAQTDDFTLVDRVEGELSFNPVPRRPMALSDDQLHLYAVNTHNSTVLHFDDSTSDPSDVFHVPKSPVSIGLWDDASDPTYPNKLVVVCEGTYALVILDRATGKILRLLELRDPVTGKIMGEPGDLLIDQAEDMAFVSCAAADAVLQVDLSTASVVSKFDLPAKDPVFMCFDAGMDVLVAPMFSGNNSGARQVPDPNLPVVVFNPQHQGPTVVDFTAPGITTRLPDVDLFRCVRAATPVPLGTVEAVTTGVGTVLFACGVHPNGKLWQLNTEANNKDPIKQTVGSVRGNIVQNRLSIIDTAAGSPPHAPTSIKDLDLTNPLLPYDPTRTVGQPYGLSFAGNFGLVTGLLTDNLMVLNGNGVFLAEVDLPAGSIPRASLYSSLFNFVYVYCWGTSKIRVLSGSLAFVRALELGYDPTPGAVQDGRRIFYDAANSERNNASCASCHVEGRTDMVVWNLSKGPIDDKGPMVTQTLAGIEKLVPFHWRGEQQLGLIDFNPAFVDLLGAPAQLSPADFAAFERFVFSIQNRPNPFENEERLVDDSIQAPRFALAPMDGQAAALGQALFAERCENCHQFPTGTSNDTVGDGALKGDQNPRRHFVKITPFNEGNKKEQDTDKTPDVSGDNWVDTVTITLPSLTGGAPESSKYPLLGAGTSHAGLITNLDEFVASFSFPQLEVNSIAAFIFQWDQGVAPAAYRGVLLEDASDLAAVNALIDQADLVLPHTRNCDIAVFGTSVINGTPTPMRWYYDRNLVPPFVPEVASLSRQDLSSFPLDGSNTFIGLPVGSGRRFAIDFDEDEFLNGDEATMGTDPFDPLDPPPPADSTDPTLVATTVMATSRVARINVETSEPCVATVTYALVPGGAQQTKSTSEYVRTQSIVLNDLSKASTYDVSVTVTDRAGNPATEVLPDLTTRNGNGNSDIVVIGNLGWGPITKHVSSGTIIANVNVRVDLKNSGGPPPLPGVRVIARIFVNGAVNSSFGAPSPSTKLTGFKFLDSGGTPVDFTGLSGPFLLSPATSATGQTTLKFNLSGLSSGDKVELNVELVGPEDTGQPTFTLTSISRWNMPATAAINRTIGLGF